MKLTITLLILVLAACQKTTTTSTTTTSTTTAAKDQSLAEKAEDAATRARLKAEKLKAEQDAKAKQSDEAMNP